MELRPYQLEGVKFLNSHPFAMLTDQMGLGKTAQAIMSTTEEATILIICPNSITHWWQDELERWTGRERGEILTSRSKSFSYTYRFHIVNWEAVRLIQNVLLPEMWDIIIADEGHRMRNRNTQQSKMLRRLAARRKIVLTGTPVVNDYTDLWAIFNFLFPAQYRSYWRWFEEEINSIKMPWGGYKILGLKHEEEFLERMSQFTLGRTVEEVNEQLPPLVETVVPIELSKKQRTVYDKLRKEFIAELDSGEEIVAYNALSKLTRLRQIASGLFLLSDTERDSSKVDALLELIEDRLPCVIFTQWVGMAQWLGSQLAGKSVVVTGKGSYFTHETGDNFMLPRHQALRAFTQGSRDVLIITTDTGSEGLNLQVAKTVFFMELPWTAATMEQAIARVHRPGQEHSMVEVLVLETVNTVEPRIRKIVERKGNIMQIVAQAFRELIS